ncbi:hypothetical protein llg_11960 [Luteolibacter sp. LG18]|nr:hypothetical protein llg_11960 [Luteolibacter sp. LG18]
MEICPVCFWEDVGEACWLIDQPTLAEAQRNFLAHGATAAQFLNMVRPPSSEEARSGHWLSVEQMREKILRFVEESFEKVLLGNGMNLAQQGLLEDWHTDAQYQSLAGSPQLRWQDIPDSALISLRHLTLNCLDPVSVRFHLPAFLRFTLKSNRHRELCHNLIFYSLECGPTPDDQRFNLLSKSQHQAVAAFLCFYERYDPAGNEEATKGLKAGWSQWVPDFVRLAYL